MRVNRMLRLITLLLAVIALVPLTVQAQGLSDPALQAAINAANERLPNLGRPDRWSFELLFATKDSALSCPLVSGVQLPDSKEPIIVTLSYGDVGYVVHVASDGSRAQACDPKFPSMGIQPVSEIEQASDACVVTPTGEFANVRALPDTEADQLGQITEARPALGRNEAFTWYLVQEGWVAGTVVNPTGNCLSNDLSIRRDDITLINVAAVAPPSSENASVPAQPTAVLPADFTCPPTFEGYLAPRIQRGAVTAQVEEGGLPNSLRSLPTVNSDRLGQIQPGRRLDFVWNGPQCSDGYVWWEVEIDEVRGWTAESSFTDNTYFLSPTAGNAAAQPTTAPQIALAPQTEGSPITAANVQLLENTRSLASGFADTFAWSPTTDTFAFSKGGVLSIAEYPATSPEPVSVLSDAQVTAITFEPTGGYLLAGLSDGRLHIYELNVFNTISEAPAHENAINALAMNPDGRVLATVSGSETSSTETWTMRLWDVEGLVNGSNTALIRSVRFPYPVRDVAFSADGQHLAIVAETTGSSPASALWIYGDRGSGDNTLTIALENTQGFAFVRAVPSSADGDFVYAQGNTLYSLTVATGAQRELTTTVGGVPTDAAVLATVAGGHQMAVSYFSGGEGAPIDIYNYDQLDPTVGPWTVGRLIADTVTFNSSGGVLGVRGVDGTLLFYALPRAE